MSHVFISYASTDDAIARRIDMALEDAGITAWMDTDIELDDNWNEAIDAALREASSLVVLLSPASLNSSQVTAEYWSMFTQNRRVYLMMVEPVDREALPTRLARLTCIDASQDFEQGMQTLIEAIDSAQPPSASQSSQVRLRFSIDRHQLAQVTEKLAEAGVYAFEVDPADSPDQ